MGEDFRFWMMKSTGIMEDVEGVDSSTSRGNIFAVFWSSLTLEAPGVE